MKKFLVESVFVLTLSLLAFSFQNDASFEPKLAKTEMNTQTNNMNSFISIFEIPANDLARASSFYESILDIKIETMQMPGMQMGLFPFEDQSVFGTIVVSEDHRPSANGVTIYLNAGDDLQIVLDRVAENGGEVLLPKTPHGDESGYFALFLDSEGNRLGLHSPN